MLKRLWLVLSVVWAAAFLFNGLTKTAGVRWLDLGLAAAPFVGGVVLNRVGAYILLGNRRGIRVIR